MKEMTCRQLGGACNQIFRAETFDEIVEQSKQHGKLIYQAEDAEHLKAMRDVKHLMQSPEALQSWFQQKREVFDALPNSE